MPSYDKAKMLRLLEARRLISLRANDYSSRIRDLREMISAKHRHLENTGNFYECRQLVDSMLLLPAEKARALTREQVETWQRSTYTRAGTQHSNASTGISFGLWGEYVQLLERKQRLEVDMEQLSQSRNEQFACVAPLLTAVSGWGFHSPENDL